MTTRELFQRLKKHLEKQGHVPEPRGDFNLMPDGYLESDRDFLQKNLEVALYLLEQLTKHGGDTP